MSIEEQNKAIVPVDTPPGVLVTQTPPLNDAATLVEKSGSIGLAPELQKELLDLAGASQETEKEALAKKTHETYRTFFENKFRPFCEKYGLPALPSTPAAVRLFIAHLQKRENLGRSSLNVAKCAIYEAHKSRDLRVPYLEGRNHVAFLGHKKAAVKAHGSEETEARPLLPSELKSICEGVTGNLAERDRAMLLIGFGAALRRDEIAMLDFSHVTVKPNGLRIRIAVSKTDQEGEGYSIGIAATEGDGPCAKRAWAEWLEVRGMADGPAFMSRTGRRMAGNDVHRRIRALGKRFGLELEHLSGHSLRAGFITEAARLGVPLARIQETSRHKDVRILVKYIRGAQLLEKSASKDIFRGEEK